MSIDEENARALVLACCCETANQHRAVSTKDQGECSAIETRPHGISHPRDHHGNAFDIDHVTGRIAVRTRRRQQYVPNVRDGNLGGDQSLDKTGSSERRWCAGDAFTRTRGIEWHSNEIHSAGSTCHPGRKPTQRRSVPPRRHNESTGTAHRSAAVRAPVRRGVIGLIQRSDDRRVDRRPSGYTVAVALWPAPAAATVVLKPSRPRVAMRTPAARTAIPA